MSPSGPGCSFSELPGRQCMKCFFLSASFPCISFPLPHSHPVTDALPQRSLFWGIAAMGSSNCSPQVQVAFPSLRHCQPCRSQGIRPHHCCPNSGLHGAQSIHGWVSLASGYAVQRNLCWILDVLLVVNGREETNWRTHTAMMLTSLLPIVMILAFFLELQGPFAYLIQKILLICVDNSEHIHTFLFSPFQRKYAHSPPKINLMS